MVGAVAIWGAGAMAQPSSRGAELFLLLGPEGDDAAALSLTLDEALDPSAFAVRDAAMATPLHRAAEVSRDPELIAAMVARGADVEARDAQGRTPLAWARGNPVAAAALIAAGADACEPDVAGRPALGAATLEAIRREAPDGYVAARAAFLGCLSRW
ncbi:ankyrin repeat domain-containing protein [Rubrimonas sp.]|uniref:ankyrin repeat domain-containing protein n=1 Tax=Rubrimonas sp. TaxID=2036015 RepID=UPI002FDD74C1